MSKDKEKWETLGGLARLTGRTGGTVERAILKAGIVGRKMGRFIKYPTAQVVAALQEHSGGAKPTVKLCIHCGQEPANRPRGLGWTCWHLPGVRERYPTQGDPKHTRRGSGQGGVSERGRELGRPPAEPTDALPGTEAKILVMMERAARGESLFHDKDPSLRRMGDAVLRGLLGGGEPVANDDEEVDDDGEA